MKRPIQRGYVKPGAGRDTLLAMRHLMNATRLLGSVRTDVQDEKPGLADFIAQTIRQIYKAEDTVRENIVNDLKANPGDAKGPWPSLRETRWVGEDNPDLPNSDCDVIDADFIDA